MNEEILDNIECKVCKNTSKTDFELAFKKDLLEIVRCNKCSFIFIPPYFRKQIKYTEYKDESVLKQVQAGNDWIKIQRHKLRYKSIRKYKPKGKLFDLGVGWGHFLYTGKLRGYETEGIEISEMPYIYAKENLKLNVQHIDFFNLPEKPLFYDIITLWDVLEHIDNCDEMIEKCSRMVKEDGIIVIQVPQIDSYFAKRHKEKWKMMGLDHVNYFSKNTIKKLLEQYGFEVHKIKSSLEIKLFIMYTLFPRIQKLKGKRKMKEVNSATRQEYFNKSMNKPKWILKIMVFIHNLLYQTLSTLNIGEEMVVIAQKKK
ncbi:class I SAM-dependent methyltransferase [candidate division KSB1 bacterium]|nr:class I SAM-dependent methyltransferase [candidate division KSB1 bacterium]